MEYKFMKESIMKKTLFLRKFSNSKFSWTRREAAGNSVFT